MSIEEKARILKNNEASPHKNCENRDLKKAIELAGGACALAQNLGITHQAVYAWIRRGWVPIARALQIEKTYGISMTGLLKPDLVSLLSQHVTQ